MRYGVPGVDISNEMTQEGGDNLMKRIALIKAGKILQKWKNANVVLFSKNAGKQQDDKLPPDQSHLYQLLTIITNGLERK